MIQLVSVIMPVYNAGKYVSEAIQSVLSQSHANLELIIINDGSTDRSKEIISSFKDQRIILLDQENKGVSAARNLGLQKMIGDFFCFLDADDCLTPNSIASRLKIFDDSSVFFVDGTVEIYDESLSKISRIRKASFFGNPFKELLKINPEVFFGPSWMIRRKKNHEYRFDESLTHTEDLWFYFQIASHGNFSFTEEVILKYRTSSGSAMKDLDKLAKGYTQLIGLVLENFGRQLSLFQKLLWALRIRKIMTLSFAGNNFLKKAFRFALLGK